MIILNLLCSLINCLDKPDFIGIILSLFLLWIFISTHIKTFIEKISDFIKVISLNIVYDIIWIIFNSIVNKLNFFKGKFFIFSLIHNDLLIMIKKYFYIVIY